MTPVIAQSMLSFVGSLLGIGCENAFISTASMVNKSFAEHSLAPEMARTACSTDNPDVIWEIAFAESGFRVDIAAINSAEVDLPKVLEGEAATDMARRLTAGKKDGGKSLPQNVDMGVMQMNWMYHGKGYGWDAEKMLSPKAQIEYLVNVMAPELRYACGKKWIACYHSWNPSNQRKYLKNIIKAEKRLKLYIRKLVILKKGEAFDRESLANTPLATIFDKSVDMDIAGSKGSSRRRGLASNPSKSNKKYESMLIRVYSEKETIIEKYGGVRRKKSISVTD